jgi:PAS domain S-box-containing protein
LSTDGDSVPEKFDWSESQLFLPSEDLLCLMGLDCRLQATNPEWENTLGFSVQEMHGRPLLDFVHPDERTAAAFSLDQLAASRQKVKFECRFVCKDRSYRVFQCSAAFSASKQLFCCIARDVTEQQQTEKALRDSEQRYRTLVDNAVEGIFQSTPDGFITTINSALSTLLGYASPREMMLGASSLDRIYVNPDDYQFACEELGRLDSLTMESEFRRKDGTVIPVNIKARVVRNPDGLAHQYFITDMTERHLLETAARAMEVKYRALIENAVYPIFRSSLDGRFLDVNHAFVVMLGYKSREEVMSLNIENDVYLNPGDRAKIIQHYKNSERINGLIVSWKRQGGSPIIVHLSGRKVRASTGVLEGFEFIAEEIPRECSLPPVQTISGSPSGRV